jgi:hypothetical protein
MTLATVATLKLSSSSTNQHTSQREVFTVMSTMTHSILVEQALNQQLADWSTLQQAAV